MDKKFAIFDMDGTLIDSMGYWQRLAGEYLFSRGVTPAQIPADLPERIKTATVTGAAAIFIDLFGFSGTPESIAAEINTMMDDHYRNDIPLKPGVKEYLAHLKQNGVSLCVASATAAPLMEACLTRLGVREDFAFLISCEELGVTKNTPDIYRYCAKRFGALPEQTAVFEDALFAVQAARKGGFYVVGVYDEAAESHWEEVKAIADEAIVHW